MHVHVKRHVNQVCERHVNQWQCGVWRYDNRRVALCIEEQASWEALW
jgi:hypothetical protein